jgi:hypothetical protein
VTLQFSTPLVNSISPWPEHQADLTCKLKKTQKSLLPFGWDTEPIMGAEVIIEEAFMDVFCDLMYGGGWMEIEREEVDQECNWALVSAIVLMIRGHRLTCVTPADRVRVASLDWIYRFWRLRPAYFLLGLPFRGVCPARIPPTAIRGGSKQKNAGFLLLTWKAKAMEASRYAPWTSLRCRARTKRSELSGRGARRTPSGQQWFDENDLSRS